MSGIFTAEGTNLHHAPRAARGYRDGAEVRDGDALEKAHEELQGAIPNSTFVSSVEVVNVEEWDFLGKCT